MLKGSFIDHIASSYIGWSGRLASFLVPGVFFLNESMLILYKVLVVPCFLLMSGCSFYLATKQLPWTSNLSAINFLIFSGVLWLGLPVVGITIVWLSGSVYLWMSTITLLFLSFLYKIRTDILENSKLRILDPRIVNPHNNSIINEPKNWPLKNHFTGCAAAIRSSVIEKIGMRPAEYFIYTSEADLSLRTIDANYTIEHFSDIVAFHRESPKKRLSSKFYYYYTRNGLWLIWKFYPFFPAIKETIIHLLYNFIKSLLALSPWHFFSGLFEGIRDFKKYSLEKRKPIDLYNDARLYPPIIVMISILFDKSS